MKNFLIVLSLSILNNVGLSQLTNHIIMDSTVTFPSDISIRISQNNEIRIVEIWYDSSRKITKFYQLNTNLLYWAFETDQYNQRNGHFYSLDTLKKNTTYAYYKSDTILYSYTISIEMDTISYIKLLNDSTLYNLSKSEDDLTIWLSNVSYSLNGYYKIIDLNSKKIKEYREYKTINRLDILDYKNFETKYKGYIGQPIFLNGYIVLPVGTWFYYDTEGQVVKSVAYDWVGIILSAQ